MSEKIEILDIESKNIMEFIEKLIQRTKNEKIILHNISHYFGGSEAYIEKWDIRERKNKIREIYNSKYKHADMNQQKKYRCVVEDIQIEIMENKFPDMKVTTRMVRHAIEGQ